MSAIAGSAARLPVTVVIEGLRLESPNKTRNEAWGKRKRIVDMQRAWVHTKLLAEVGLVRPALPLTITIVRIGRGVMDAHDNLPGSCKAVVDAVCAYLECKDNDARLAWRYKQERARTYGVRVEMDPRGKVTQ